MNNTHYSKLGVPRRGSKTPRKQCCICLRKVFDKENFGGEDL